MCTLNLSITEEQLMMAQFNFWLTNQRTGIFLFEITDESDKMVSLVLLFVQ